MKLIHASWKARGARLLKSFVGGKDIIKVGRKKIRLPQDIVKAKMGSQAIGLTWIRVLIIVLLGITVVGLVLAIPLFFMFKKKRLTISFETHDGETFSVMATSNREFKRLQAYSAIG